MVSFDTMKVDIAMAAINIWQMVPMDATTASLNCEIVYYVYVKPPTGANTPKDMVLSNLRKSGMLL